MKNFIIFSSLLLLVSCDYHTLTRIVNKSDNEIFVEFFFDSTTIKSTFRLDINDFYNKEEKGLISVKVDTQNYIGIYKISPNSIASIELSTGKYPSFYYINGLSIYSVKDTIQLKNKDGLREAFDVDKSEYSGTYDIIIE